MIETPDEMDTSYGIPVYSLYSEVRRPTEETSRWQMCCYDLQDLGCRIIPLLLLFSTYSKRLATKEVWVLDEQTLLGRR